MNPPTLPPFGPVEWAVIGGTFVLFSVVPGVLTWMENLRERRQAALAERAALQALAPEEPVSAPIAPVWSEGIAPQEDVESPIAATVEPAVEEAAAPAAVVEVALPVTPPLPSGPLHEFRLDELRRARVLETPRGDILADPGKQQEWEEGLRLAEAHAAVIGATSLSAPFEPHARSFAGMRDLGEIKELRFLLFPTLWPTSTDQATAQAIFELGSTGVVSARVS